MLNHVVLIGRLTRDPRLARSASGTSIVSFTVAVDDSYKNANGEKSTIFMPVTVFGNRADTVAKFTHKGSLVAVDGRLVQRKYVRNKDNVEVTSTEIVANSVEFLDPKNASASAGATNVGFTPDVAPASNNNNAAHSDDFDVLEDDIPFPFD